ncbi:cathepsin L-like proteinase, partial [Aphelenchoides avenae]
MAPKSLALLSLVLFFAGASAAAKFTAQQKTEFDGFLKRFRLKFGAKDYDARLELFQKNLKKIEGFNRHSKGARFAANKFAAMTEDEIKHYLVPLDVFNKLAASYNDSTPGHPKRGKRQAAPASIDYRANGWAPTVKDQAQCGACWAFTSCACVEAAYLRHNAVSLDLAEQHLVDCTPAPNQGCGGGILPNTMDWIIANGVGYEASYPYTSGSTGAKGICKTVSPVEKNVQYTNLGTTDAAILDWVANKGPVGFGFYVPQDFMYYAGGVYETDCAQPWAGGHAVTILGYTPDYWIIKNSWGLGWGEEGYIYWARTSPICHLSMGGYLPQVVGVTVAQPPATTTTAPQPTTTTAPQTTTSPVTTATPTTTAPVTTTAGPTSCECPNGYTYFAGSDACYKVVESVTFDDASRLCAQDGGALASIHSEAENKFITGFIAGGPHWIAFVN